MRQRTMEIVLGLVILCGLLILAVLIIGFGAVLKLSRPTYRISAVFTEVSGLSPGVPVRQLGIDIGRLADHEVLPEGRGVKLDLEIYRKHLIPVDAELRVETEGMLGDTYLSFGSGKSPDMIPDGGEVRNVRQYIPFSRIMAQATENLKTLPQTLQKINDVADSINKRLSNEEFFKNLDKSMAAVPDAVERFKTMTDTINKQTEAFVTDSRQLMQDWKELSVKLDKQVDHQGENMDRVTAGLVSNVEHLNKLLATLDEISQTVNKGDGTVGGLMKRDEVYKEIVSTLEELQKALDEIRATAKFIGEHPDSVFWGRKE